MQKIFLYLKNINYNKLWLTIKLICYIPKSALKLNADEQYEVRKHRQRRKPFSFEEKSGYMISKEWQNKRLNLGRHQN